MYFITEVLFEDISEKSNYVIFSWYHQDLRIKTDIGIIQEIGDLTTLHTYVLYTMMAVCSFHSLVSFFLPPSIIQRKFFCYFLREEENLVMPKLPKWLFLSDPWNRHGKSCFMVVRQSTDIVFLYIQLSLGTRMVGFYPKLRERHPYSSSYSI